MSKISKKEAKRRERLEKARQLKRDVLERELKYSDLTMSKQEKEWRKLIMGIAVPQMREELEFAWISFERAMDNKDYTITLLMEELNDSDEQYIMNCKNHVEHIDYLISMFEERIEELKADYNNKIDDLETTTEEEIRNLNEVLDEDENYLKTVMYMLEVAKKELKSNARAEYLSKVEEEDTKNAQILQRLRIILEHIHSQIEKETDEILEDYNKHIKAKQEEYEELRTQDEYLRNLLNKQLNKIKKMHDYIKDLNVEYAEYQKESERKLKDLENEYQFFNNAFSILKKRLEDDRELDAKKLEVLTVCYNETITYLEKIKTKGEHLLHMAAVCRKLETLEEKILPFPCANLEHIKVDLEDKSEYIKSLDVFWQRVGQAEASRYALLEERTFYEQKTNYYANNCTSTVNACNVRFRNRK